MMDPDLARPDAFSDAQAGSKFGPEAIARLRSAFERSRNPMLIADDQRRWITGNAAASELLRIPGEEIPWRTMDEFTVPGERKRLEEQWDAFLATGAAEGWYGLNVPERGPTPVEFSATANVLPARHLSVFVPVHGASGDEVEVAFGTDAPWRPVAAEVSGRLQLTEREREVMTLVASGMQSGDIAASLYLSTETVKSHVQNAMGKLGAHTRAHAVAISLVTGQIAWET